MTGTSPPRPPISPSFVGREHELLHLSTLLHDAACRLLTIVGAGGIGKTRIAQQLVDREQQHFADGAWFVSLQSVQYAEQLVPIIAGVVGCPLASANDPRAHLLSFVSTWQALLVLDNFEHLLEHSDLVVDLLAAAPEITVIVTSREVLNIQDEWRYALGGLRIPSSTRPEDIDNASAVQLFAERARRLRTDFSLASERTHVAELCRLVDGIPLAIELAAAWVGALPCATIAANIAQNLDLLTSRLRDVPQRHRSMRATFDSSWHLLSEQEQRLFTRLAIFQGGFTHTAAEQVVGASLPLLAALVDKSLIRHSGDDRYQMHELLRQYAEEQLAATPDDLRQTRQAHADYYIAFVVEQSAALEGSGQQGAIGDIGQELPNICIAWEWAIEHADVDALARAEYMLSNYYHFRGPYQQGTALLEQALTCLRRVPATRETDLARASTLNDLGGLYIWLGRPDAAHTVLEESENLYARHSVPPRSGMRTDPLLGLSIIAFYQGDFTESARLALQVRQRSEAHGNTANVLLSAIMLANTCMTQRHYQEAQAYAEDAVALARQTRNGYLLAYHLNDLGLLFYQQGQFAQARTYLYLAVEEAEKAVNWQIQGIARYSLARTAFWQAQYQEAEELLWAALTILQDTGDHGNQIFATTDLGRTVLMLGRAAEARDLLQQALYLATSSQQPFLIIYVLPAVSEWVFKTGAEDRAIEVLCLVLGHPACDEVTRQWARRALEQIRAAVKPAALAAAQERGRTLDLDTAVIWAQQTLTRAVLEQTQDEDAPAAPAPASPSTQAEHAPLIAHDALTGRELEVLRLIRDGCSNQEIANRLTISLSTVKWYTNQIYSKFGVRSRTQAVVQAQSLGLLA